MLPSPIATDTLTLVTAIDTTATSTFNDVANIRQYIPLVVSLLVIVDILLGSPLANGVLNQLRPTTTTTTSTTKENDNDTISSFTSNTGTSQSKERIDSQKVAQDAIQRARYTLELRAFLDAQRDPVTELQRKMDEQSAVLEQNTAQLQAEMQRSSKKQ
jgi:hypothetical protein